ncbi:MAG TPA: hypothetical protein VI749_03015 [Candidatus Omnitrophota bacterium]|nr:hypothetical protein [Candidatus Omnitrophota bacterium]
MALKKYSIIFLGSMVVLLMFVVQFKNSSAQNSSFAQVIPMDGGQGAIRFFDTATGKLYTYDRTLQDLISVVQIEELGKPAKVIFTATPDAELKYTDPQEK